MTEASEQSEESGIFSSFYSSLMKPSQPAGEDEPCSIVSIGHESTEMTDSSVLETNRSMAADSDDELEESPLKSKERRARD